jgi:hypothetical protein
MPARPFLRWLAAAVMLLQGAPASAGPCAPAQIASDAGALPEAWRSALARLVEATAVPGRPWSCNGARLALEVDAAGRAGRLLVTMEDWPRLERDIPAPDELVPIGEAMLARPLSRPAPPPVAAPPPEPAAPPPEPTAPRSEPAAPRPAGERLTLGALAGPRYSGHVNALWVGGTLRAMLPLDRWTVGVWGRYETAVLALQPTPADYHLLSGSVGLSAGYRLLDGPLQLTASIEPSLAVIAFDGGADESHEVEGARGDPRVGARLQGAWPVGDRWRLLFALDGEIAPLALGSARHRTIDPALPPIPSFTLGASLGGEIVIR